jgi:N-acetylneuraminic acid mutarotase
MRKILIALVFPVLVSGTCFAQQAAGKWTLVKTNNKIEGRSECSLVAANGKLYLIGGDGPAAPVEEYNPATNEWTKKAMAPVVMHHLQAVALGDKLFVLDAFYEGGFPNQTPMPNAYSYDTKTDNWTKLAEVPEARRRAGAGEAVHDGKLYLVCGITHGHSNGTNAMFDEYDPATNSWRVLPDAPHIRDHSMAVVVDDKLYAIGGRNTSFRDPDEKLNFFSQTILDVDCYDFKTGTWTTLPAKLPMGTGGGTAVNLDGKLFYIGGERATDTAPNHSQKDVYYFDPLKSITWTKAADLNMARNGVGGAVLNHKIYIAGGAGGPGGPPPGGKMQTMPGLPGNNVPPGPPPGMPPPGPGGYGGGDIALEVFTLNQP